MGRRTRLMEGVKEKMAEEEVVAEGGRRMVSAL